MDGENINKKKKPLAYGFLSKDKIYFNFRFNFTAEITFYNKLGQDLIDFAWFDKELATEIFKSVWTIYVFLRAKKNDYNFIAAGLLT
jgi:hypothetical protein